MVQKVILAWESALANWGVVQSLRGLLEYMLPGGVDISNRPLGQQQSCVIDSGLE